MKHARKHNDPAANRFAFLEVLKATTMDKARGIANSTNAGLAKDLLALHVKCVVSSAYAPYLQAWVNYFSARQVSVEYLN